MTLPLPLGGVQNPQVRYCLERIAMELPAVQVISASDRLFTGTVRITGGANITVSTDASGLSIIGAGGTGGAAGSLVPAGNTSGTTASLPFSGNIQLAGGNNITLSQSSGASSTRMTISGAAQSSETGSLVPAGNTTGTTASLPFNQNIQLAGGPNITVSQSSGASSTNLSISGAAQSSETGSLQPAGNTTGTTANLPFNANVQLAGGPNITLSQSSGASSSRMSISAAAQSSETGSLQPAGNTAGTTANLPFNANIQIAGGNNITISQSSGASSTNISIVGAAGGTGGADGGVGVIASNTTWTAGTITITGSDWATIKTAASQVIVDVKPPPQENTILPFPLQGPLSMFNATLLPSGSGAGLWQGWHQGQDMSVDSIHLAMSGSAITSTATGNIRVDVFLGTRNGSSVSSLATSSYTTSWTSGTAAGGGWLSWYANSVPRRVDIPFATSLVAGSQYFLGVQLRSAGNWAPFLGVATRGVGYIKPGVASSATGSGAAPFGFGYCTQNISGTANIAGSDIINSTGAAAYTPWVHLRATGSNPW